MESLINTISSNPVYLAILIIFSILLVYAFVKKIIKLVFVVGILLIVYAVYSNSVGKVAHFEVGGKKVSFCVRNMRGCAIHSIKFDYCTKIFALSF